MKITIKNSVMFTLIVAGVLINSLVMASSGKVSGGKHDFSTNSSTAAQNKDGLQSQVCIFCHTPHNSGENRLLWNKAGSPTAANFRLYTSSTTISNFTKTAALTASSPSILCLSCHDGKTAMNVMHTSGAGITADTAGLPGYPAGSRLVSGTLPKYMTNIEASELTGDLAYTPNIGGTTGYDLSNDHPIGFSYSDVMTDPPHAAALNIITLVGTKSSDSIRFFGDKKTVECSSCHDPHIDGTILNQKPFLVMDNTGSKLCLACHNK